MFVDLLGFVHTVVIEHVRSSIMKGNNDIFIMIIIIPYLSRNKPCTLNWLHFDKALNVFKPIPDGSDSAASVGLNTLELRDEVPLWDVFVKPGTTMTLVQPIYGDIV